ncbi:BMP family ABC transporter substrate-binding protein [Sinorhizobium meliloti]|uniref:BMP family ABC transporter substrate-binding protein n=1 Tax=Rhizobium meliloti TaxID=382 RepID=A0A6A7ZIC2_RHIML|nr:BMP family protein [Sinorhizobium meliloti]MDW9369428.1 BMP family ABC transporter substrate-binding protein [Sinorhizobium meliloti]MDX0056516.1 BMP family ABC transporter substrate-binding protein [Sinorhizobium meliloti]MDX0136666.1 BMP family ABC transporter substrate-binding protein [Sinorhizobium meliloti]MDX0379983.1 BMP family ABC transporter substrate-binding protein [Sinorhizobium meliloti]MQW02733.1 BMP family ABC transporter substrate-binding protein [Sinorhizobium meliloti]
MTRDLMMSRRNVLASGLVLGVSALAPAVRASAPIKVAGVHASPVENAWNSVLHKALQDAAAEGVIEYVFSEGISGTDYPRAMREYAEQGAKLIIGEAYAVEKQAREVAADYAETAFVLGSSGKESGDNFGVFGTWNHDGAYLAGMLAGKMTKSNVVGSVGAMPIPEVNMLINAFAAGVKAVNPDAKHLVTFIGTFFDPPKAREAGLAQIDAGADILFGERIGTADAAKERGLKSVGSLIDYTPRYPDTVFANALWGFRPILNAAIADVSAGKPVGKDYTAFGLLKEGGSDIAYVKGVAPADAEAAMEAKRAEIKSGAFEVPRITDEPK